MASNKAFKVSRDIQTLASLSWAAPLNIKISIPVAWAFPHSSLVGQGDAEGETRHLISSLNWRASKTASKPWEDILCLAPITLLTRASVFLPSLLFFFPSLLFRLSGGEYSGWDSRGGLGAKGLYFRSSLVLPSLSFPALHLWHRVAA